MLANTTLPRSYAVVWLKFRWDYAAIPRREACHTGGPVRLVLRYGTAALLMAALAIAAIAAISPFASTLVEQWERQDTELRSVLVFNSVRDELTVLLADQARPQIVGLFERLALDERLIAAGFCNSAGRLSIRADCFPRL